MESRNLGAWRENGRQTGKLRSRGLNRGSIISLNPEKDWRIELRCLGRGSWSRIWREDLLEKWRRGEKAIFRGGKIRRWRIWRRLDWSGSRQSRDNRRRESFLRLVCQIYRQKDRNPRLLWEWKCSPKWRFRSLIRVSVIGITVLICRKPRNLGHPSRLECCPLRIHSIFSQSRLECSQHMEIFIMYLHDRCFLCRELTHLSINWE